MPWAINPVVITFCLLVFIPLGADLKRSAPSSDKNESPLPVLSVPNPAEYGLGHGRKLSEEDSKSDASDESDVDNGAVADKELANLEYIGCYDVWENQKVMLTDTILSESSLTNCSRKCNYDNYNPGPPRGHVVGVRAHSCMCPYEDTFGLTRVSDRFCSIDCATLDPALEPGTWTCGGHFSLSVYCRKGSGDCTRFADFPTEDLYKENSPEDPPTDHLPLPLPVQQPIIFDRLRGAGGENSPFCVNCSWCHSTIRPAFDYIPNNTPEICRRFCRRRITYYKQPYQLETRQPSEFALAGWANKSLLVVNTCGCPTRIDGSIEEVPSDFCDTPCGNGEPCGSASIQYAVSMYRTRVSEDAPQNPLPLPDTTTINPVRTTWITTSTTTTTTTESSSEEDIDEDTTKKPPQDPPPGACNGQGQCLGVDPYENPWEACPGETPVDRCPNGATGEAFWKCLDTGQFDGASPDYTACSTVWVKQLQDVLENSPNASAIEILTKVENMTSLAKVLENKDAQYFGHEIAQIMRMVEGVVKDGNLTQGTDLSGFEEMTRVVTFIADSVLSNSRTWKQLTAANSSMSATSLLQTLEESSFELAEEAEMNGFSDYNQSSQSSIISVLSGVVSISETGAETLKFDDAGSYVQLPQGWEDALPPTVGPTAQCSGMAIATSGLGVNPFPSNIIGLSAGDRKDLNGKIMSFSLTRPTENTTITFPDGGVKILIEHDVRACGNRWERQRGLIRRKLHFGEEPKAIFGTAVCAYWNTTLGIWSQDGCRLVESDIGATRCDCSHLTSFAVLFSYYNYVEKSLALEVLTIVLCSLSVISLVATIVIFTVVRSTHGLRTTITKNLAFCLLLGNVLVLLVVDRNYFNMSEGVCIGAGIVTHYAFLCAFMWMAIEGFHLYKMMVHVFDSGHSHMTLLRILAYGLPLLIVVVTGSVGALMGDKPYGGEEFCWLNGSYSLAFIVPISFVICGNLIVLAITLKTAYQVQGAPAQMHDRKRSYRRYIRGCFSITILLGVTWIFGYVQLVGSLTSEIAAYIFTILNASQGFLLFIYHCLLNEKVRLAAERRNIRYPAWLSEAITTTKNTTSGPSGSAANNSRFGRQNVKSFYSDSATGKKELKFSAGGPLEGFRNHGFKASLNYKESLKNLDNVLKGQQGQSAHGGTVSSTSSSNLTASGNESNQSQNDLLPQFRRGRQP